MRKAKSDSICVRPKRQILHRPKAQDGDKEVGVTSQVSNDLANISHKNTFGANNWQKFVESQPLKNSSYLSSRPTQNSMHPNRPSFNQNLKKNVVEKGLDKKTYRLTDELNCAKANIESEFTKGDSKPDVLSLSQNQGNFKQKMPGYNTQTSLFHNIQDRSCNNLEFSRGLNRAKQPKLTKQVAMDCEMVGVEVGVDNSMLARVSLVNAEGDCIYDKYVKPTEPVLDYRTSVSGVRPEDLVNAPDFKTVQKEVADIISGRVLVGHALKNDLKVLFLTHPYHLIRDTSKFKKFRLGTTPALKKLAKTYLGVSIQESEHSSVQDALAAMQLYRMFRKEWEGSFYKKNKKSYPYLKKEKNIKGKTSFTSSVDV